MLAAILFWSILSYIAIRAFILEAAIVQGTSMEPAFYNGDRVIIKRWPYYFRQPRRGEIVALRMPGDADVSVKRVIALAGEKIQLGDSAVRVNGKVLEESYLAIGLGTKPNGLSTNAYLIAPDCYFVLGDNRSASTDSRLFGAIHRRAIVGLIR